MEFESIECTCAFFDDYTGCVFYAFKTEPQIDHGEWAISSGGDIAYNLANDNITESEFPLELLALLDHIPDDIEIDGWEDE